MTSALYTKRLEELRRSRGQYEDLLQLCGAVLDVIEEHRERANVKSMSVGDEIMRHLRDKRPFLRQAELELDWESAHATFESLCSRLHKLNPTLRAQIDAIGEARRASRLHLGQALRRAAQGDCNARGWLAASETESIKPEVLGLLVHESLRPNFIGLLRDAASPQSKSVDLDGHCPACGSPAAIGYLRAQDGQRMLYCCLCGNHWPVSYLRCVWCGNTDHTTMRYLFAEQEPECLIDVCESCKGYLKAYDERKLLHPTVPALEYAASLHLELIAEDQGYRKKTLPLVLF